MKGNINIITHDYRGKITTESFGNIVNSDDYSTKLFRIHVMNNSKKMLQLRELFIFIIGELENFV